MVLAETRDLVKTFTVRKGGRKGKLNAVGGVSLQIEKGACTALVGESGCGKSTLGKILIGFERPTAGSVFYEGREFRGLPSEKMRRRIQLVSQDSYDAVNPRFNAEQIVQEPLIHFFGMEKAECSARVDELLRQVGIDPQEKTKYPRQFSGGQLQRICIARALAAEPELIVLDEPLSSLDVSVQAQILNLLADLKEQNGLSYLLISHDLEAVYYLADVIYIMYQGKIVEIVEDLGRIREVQHPYSRKLLFGEDTKSAILI